jgi:hypothetical protein
VSHSHSISAMSAALQQQEYMERLRAAQHAEREERIRKKAKAFDYILNHDRESGGQSHEESPENEEQPQDEPETEQTEGFGTHYA